MAEQTTNRLVEKWLPLSEVNSSSNREQGFIRAPKLSNIHPWPARRPCTAARVNPSICFTSEF